MGKCVNDERVKRELGERLKQARRQQGLTQEEVAIALGCALNSYWRIEAGEGAPSMSRIVELAQMYKVSIDWLFGLTDMMTPVWAVN